MSLIWFIDRTLFTDFSNKHNSKSIFKARLKKYSFTKFYNILYVIFLMETSFVFVNLSTTVTYLSACLRILPPYELRYNFICETSTEILT
jgi:hypothetical protein